jgi:DNA repair exonuclease SbcCD nuclease subunit
MPYGLMADLHLHAWSAFAFTNMDGVNSRLIGLLDEIERCAAAVAKADGRTIVMAGDVFHVRGSVNPVVLNSLKDTLAGCHKRYGTEFVIIPGNHDLTGRDSDRLGSAVTALECGYVQVSADSLELCGGTMYTERFGGVMLVPWHEKIDDLKLEILQLRDEIVAGSGKPADYDLVLHAPIDGVIQGLPAHGLTPEWLAQTGFHRVFSGHYHHHKQFPLGAGDKTQVWSIGALAHLTWSDVGTKAGFLIVERERVHWHKSHLPQFVDLAQLTTVEPEDIPLLVDGNYVRVRVEADKSKEVERARQELMEMGARAVLVQPMPKAPVRTGATAAVPTIAAGASLEASVTEFVHTMPGLKLPGAVGIAAMDVLASVVSD